MGTRYTAVFEFDGEPPSVCITDKWLGGQLCAVSFQDDIDALKKLTVAAEHVMRDFESHDTDSINELAELVGWEFEI